MIRTTYGLVKPLLFRMDAERAHELVTGLLRVAAAQPLAARLIGALLAFEDPVLATRCAGLSFANPLGMAAGFDKHAELVRPIGLLGFGHVEVGTVTPRPQPGNPRPRLFRLPADEALINRMGFNSPGAETVAAHLGEYARRPHAGDRPIVGVNIGKNRETPLERAADDYVAAFDRLAPLADYLTVNISSPNTPGLRKLHEREALEQLLGAVSARNQALARPVFLKISPDEPLGALEQVVAAGLAAGCAGFVATNTTLARDCLRGRAAREAGGLSGRPLAARARETVARVFALTRGAVPVIGVGGVTSGADAYAMIRAGAQLVQIYTSLIYVGPTAPQRIKRELADLLARDGFRSVADAVGVDSTP